MQKTNESYAVVHFQCYPEISFSVMESTDIADIVTHLNKTPQDAARRGHYGVVWRIGETTIPIGNFPFFEALERHKKKTGKRPRVQPIVTRRKFRGEEAR